MNAAVLHALGELPRCEAFPDPVTGEGEVLVEVRAASLKPVDRQMASGAHYASFRKLPVVCGTDGVGILEDGSRVFFAMPRAPHGAMAEHTVVARPRCFPLPDDVDDDTAAAVMNPGLSAWGALVWRAQLAAGETVLVWEPQASPVNLRFRRPSCSVPDGSWARGGMRRFFPLWAIWARMQPSLSIKRARI